MGRFITKDSYEGDISNPLSINQYAYCSNNPLGYIDPSGHIQEEYLNGYVFNNYGEVIGTCDGPSRTDTSQEATDTHGGSQYMGNTTNGGYDNNESITANTTPKISSNPDAVTTAATPTSAGEEVSNAGNRVVPNRSSAPLSKLNDVNKSSSTDTNLFSNKQLTVADDILTGLSGACSLAAFVGLCVGAAPVAILGLTFLAAYAGVGSRFANDIKYSYNYIDKQEYEDKKDKIDLGLGLTAVSLAAPTQLSELGAKGYSGLVRGFGFLASIVSRTYSTITCFD